MADGDWWKCAFGERPVRWLSFTAERHCCASDAGEPCDEPGAIVVVFEVGGRLGVSTVCERHFEKWHDEAKACGHAMPVEQYAAPGLIDRDGEPEGS